MYTRVIVRRMKNWSTYESLARPSQEGRICTGNCFLPVPQGKDWSKMPLTASKAGDMQAEAPKKNPNLFTRSP